MDERQTHKQFSWVVFVAETCSSGWDAGTELVSTGRRHQPFVTPSSKCLAISISTNCGEKNAEALMQIWGEYPTMFFREASR